MSQPELHCLPTGVPQLDRLLGGGLPARRCLLVTGLPGTGKSILVGQLAFAQAARGWPVVIATASGEPHTRLLESLQGFSFFDRERLGREVLLLSAEAWLRKGGRELRDMLLATVRERGVRLLVLDGLRTLHEAWQDPVRVRDFLGDLSAGLATGECTGVLVDDREPADALVRPAAAVADGVLGLMVEAEGAERLRRIEVLKLRGRFALPGPHALTLSPDGIRVHPRLEVLDVGAAPALPSEERVPSGVGGLDVLLGGGVPSGAVVLLSGPARTGKSLLGASFAAAGTGPVVHLLLHEPGEALRTRALAAGIVLEEGAGRWSALSCAEPGLEPDGVAEEVLARAERLGACRVVVDGLEVLARAVRPRSRLRSFGQALVKALRARGLTAVLTLDPTDGEEAAALARWLRVDVRLVLRAPALPGARVWPLLPEQAPGATPGMGTERALRVGAAGVEVVGAAPPPGGRVRNRLREGGAHPEQGERG